MDDLTLEQAERCARACGWLGIVEAANAGWIEHPEDAGDYYTDNLFFPVLQPDGSVVGVECDGLDLDPYYWFPRLWDAGIFHKKHKHPWDTIRFIRELIETIIHTAKYSVRDICLALCEAIEALEEK